MLSYFNNVVKIKKGGQKTVYRAEDPRRGPVIVKIGTARSRSGLERIQREAVLLREISSPYYPKNYDFQLLPGGSFLIVEELIDGKPLMNYLTSFSSEQRAADLVTHLVRGLTELWNLHIAHCDIKPGNILILKDKTPKIIDLGIAKILPGSLCPPLRKSRVHCTPSYASPEQLRNQPSQVDYRTDQYSLGIVFAQLLLGGQHPFSPNLVAGSSIPENILADNWYRKVLKDCRNSTVRQVLRRLLAWKPAQRYADPNQLMEEIRQTFRS